MQSLREDIENVQRLEEIAGILFREELGYILDELELAGHLPVHKRLQSKRHPKPKPERLRETLEELGTVFVKFGQIMSERPDIVPEKYIEELKKLQDSANQFDPEKALEIVDEEVGLEKYEEVDKEPIAAASIAQVHRGKLKSGEEVILKIRRPGIKEKVNRDLDVLQYLASKAEKHSQLLQDVRLGKLVKEFSNWTESELDFTEEASNAEIFKKNLEEEENLKVPEVYRDATTEKVLTMEYVEGVKVTNAEALDEMDIETEDLARTVVRAGFKQVVDDGFFHADPHPSNFLIQEQGRIAYLDFGMMGRISKRYRDKIGLLFVYTMKEETDKALDVLLDMGWTREDPDLEAIERKLDRKIAKLQNRTVQQTQISGEFLDLFVFAGQKGLYMPLQLTLMAKNMVTLEGIGLTVCPDFKPAEEYKDKGEKILIEKNSPKDMVDQMVLDMIENKDMVTRPFTELRKTYQEKDDRTVQVRNSFSMGGLPLVLILTSALLMIGARWDPRLFYIGLGELLLGLYLNR